MTRAAVQTAVLAALFLVLPGGQVMADDAKAYAIRPGVILQADAAQAMLTDFMIARDCMLDFSDYQQTEDAILRYMADELALKGSQKEEARDILNTAAEETFGAMVQAGLVTADQEAKTATLVECPDAG